MAIIVGSASAGIGGMLYMIMPSSSGTFQNSITLEAMGWISLALVIFTLWRPLISLVGSFVFGALYICSSFLDSTIPQKILEMLPYFVTIIVLIVTSIMDSKKAQPPARLGLNYFREER